MYYYISQKCLPYAKPIHKRGISAVILKKKSLKGHHASHADSGTVDAAKIYSGTLVTVIWL